MPDAALGIGAGANLLGGFLQMIAAAQARKKMDEQFANELARQRGFRNEALGVTQPYFPTLGVETARQQMGEGAAHRNQEYERVGNAPVTVNQPMGFGPSGADKGNIRMAGQARANLGGYSDWQLDQLVKKIRTQDELNRISNFSRGTASVFPYRMNEAQHSWDDLAAIGNLISSVGGGAQGWGELFGNSGPSGGPLSIYSLPRYQAPTGLFDASSGFGSQFSNIG